MKPPRVTVVIPNHNYARFVGQAIDSALAQTYRDLEVVVIDNGSTDHSVEILKAYGDRIRWITQENRGQSGARNRGIEEARGELIAFLDADDVWLPSKLEKQVPLFSDPQVGLVYCGLTVADAELRPTREILPEKQGHLLPEFGRAAISVIVGGESTAVIRKKCFAELGGFDPRLSICAGWDMYRRICGRYAVGVVREPLMRYRVHGTNAHGRIDVFERDVLLRLEKMFADPEAAVVHSMKRQSYGQSYLLLSGSFYGAGKPLKAVKYGALAALLWPPALKRIAGFPLRRLGRRPA